MSIKTKQSKEFYDILGVGQDATADALRKAYRKKALELHPDKRGNSREAQDQFTRMKRAYDVLSDTRKRQIYDHTGEDGIKLIEEFGSLGPDELVAAMFGTLGAIGMKGKCYVMLLLTLLFTFLVSIPIFWCLRADETVTWNWLAVFSPLWIMDMIYFTCVGCSYFSSIKKKDPQDRRNCRAAIFQLYKFGKSSLLFILQIAIAMRLNHDIDWTIKEVMLPYFMFDVLSWLECLGGGLNEISLLQKQCELAGIHMVETIQQQKVDLMKRICVQLGFVACRLLQGLAICAKLDGNLGSASWWIVFIPTWSVIGYFVWQPISKYRIARQASEENEITSNDTDKESSQKTSVMEVINPVFVIAILSSPYFLLSARLENEQFSTLYIILPWLILIGLLLCILCCIIACLGFNAHTEDDEESDAEFSEDSFRSDQDGIRLNDLELNLSNTNMHDRYDKELWMTADDDIVESVSHC